MTPQKKNLYKKKTTYIYLKYIASDCNLHGSIPEWLFNHANKAAYDLFMIQLHNNHLSGILPQTNLNDNVTIATGGNLIILGNLFQETNSSLVKYTSMYFKDISWMYIGDSDFIWSYITVTLAALYLIVFQCFLQEMCQIQLKNNIPNCYQKVSKKINYNTILSNWFNQMLIPYNDIKALIFWLSLSAFYYFNSHYFVDNVWFNDLSLINYYTLNNTSGNVADIVLIYFFAIYANVIVFRGMIVVYQKNKKNKKNKKNSNHTVITKKNKRNKKKQSRQQQQQQPQFTDLITSTPNQQREEQQQEREESDSENSGSFTDVSLDKERSDVSQEQQQQQQQFKDGNSADSGSNKYTFDETQQCSFKIQLLGLFFCLIVIFVLTVFYFITHWLPSYENIIYYQSFLIFLFFLFFYF